MSVRARPAILSSAAALAAALVFTAGALAHGGETSFVAEPSRVAPGDGVGVQADLLTSGPISLALVGIDGSRREAGIAEPSQDVHLDIFVQIPPDLPVGPWTLQAEVDGVVLASTTLEVAGVAVGAGGAGQGSRDRDEVRLAPLPPGSQASRSAAPATIPAGARTVDPSIDLAPFVALGWGLAALVVLAVRTRHLAGN